MIEVQPKNAIVIDGTCYVISDTEDVNECEECALLEKCIETHGALCNILHGAEYRQHYIIL